METLTAEVSAKEPELRAALAAEDDKQEVRTTADAETRELAAVHQARPAWATFSWRPLRSARRSEGAPAELQKHYGLGSHQVPLDAAD